MSNDKLAQALREIKGCEDYFQVQAIVDKAIAEHEAEKQAGPVAAYTEGHCAEKRKPGGCTLHNLHCGYPACDRKAAPPSESDKEDAEQVTVRFNLTDKALPDACDYSESYGGQWSSDWCVCLKDSGSVEVTRFTVLKMEKEALSRGSRAFVRSSWWQPGWGMKYVAWAYRAEIEAAIRAARAKKEQS